MIKSIQSWLKSTYSGLKYVLDLKSNSYGKRFGPVDLDKTILPEHMDFFKKATMRKDAGVISCFAIANKVNEAPIVKEILTNTDEIVNFIF